MALRSDDALSRLRLGADSHRAMVWPGHCRLCHRACGAMSGIKLVIAGANGRMGRTLQVALAEAKDFELIAALKRGDDPLPALAKAEVLIDFSSPTSSVELAGLAAQK